MNNYKLDILGVREVRWNKFGEISTAGGEVNISAGVNQRATIEEAVFSAKAALRLYNEDLKQLRERKLRESLEMAVSR
jgi:hypothetical protein